VLNLEGEDYLTAAEACARLGVKASTLYAYVSRGLLRSYRQGIRRRRLYKRRDVERLLQLRPSTSPADAPPGGAATDGDPAPGSPPSGDSARPQVPRAEDWIPFVN
jgi:excisionase family DNA binding protein